MLSSLLSNLIFSKFGTLDHVISQINIIGSGEAVVPSYMYNLCRNILPKEECSLELFWSENFHTFKHFCLV